MSSDRNIAPEMWTRIVAELKEIEAANQVRILLAVESGSRAWRFPSPDSDYDVRFIYLRPRRDYLSVSPIRDVIERPVDALLDIGGWDLRKALGLMAGSNAVLQEWLTSPIRYQADSRIAAELLSLAAETADIGGYLYHYDRMARRHFETVMTTAQPRFKTYCYALRPVFALRWLTRHRTLPPMDMPRLMEQEDIAPELGQVISELIARKALAGEQETMVRNDLLADFIADNLREIAARRHAKCEKAMLRVDRFFADLVLGNVEPD